MYHYVSLTNTFVAIFKMWLGDSKLFCNNYSSYDHINLTFLITFWGFFSLP